MKTKEEIRDKYSRLWFNDDDDLDDVNTGYISWPDVLKAMQEYHDQFKQPISDEEIDGQFPLTYFSGAVELDDPSAKFKREGAKWIIERMAKDERELILKFMDWYFDMRNVTLTEKQIGGVIDMFLNSNK